MRFALTALVAVVLALSSGPELRAEGAILYKGGPIQVTEDGATVWVVNPDHDAVSAIDTATGSVSYHELPAASAGAHRPRGLGVVPDGDEVWVACHDSGMVIVLDATDGAVIEELELHPGSGPANVAIDPDGDTAWVVLHRSAQVAIYDTATYELLTVVDGLQHHPWGISFTEDGSAAWLTHTLMDGEDSYLTAVDTSDRVVVAKVIMKSVNPKSSSQISGDPDPVPEGGYLIPIGQLAQPPGLDQMWVPFQYMNFHNPEFTPDSTVQAAIHKIDLDTNTQFHAGRVVLSGVYAHDNTTLLGDGWNAGIAGPIDLGFDAVGDTAYLVNAYSNNVLVFATDIEMERGSDAALTEIPVGDHPLGIAVSPTDDTAYVLNVLSRDVSVIDLVAEEVTDTIDVTPDVDEPLDEDFLTGARLFHSSADPRVSSTGKVACASCHVRGQGDGLMWDFASLGAGNRKTLNLLGLAHSFGDPVDGRGQLHRSGDRDEVQDFEHTFRSGVMGGTGFLDDPNDSLGEPNADLDADLDALATYVLGLPSLAVSPHRNDDGTLTEAAVRGGLIFQGEGNTSDGAGCNDCHTAPDFTDRDFHDVDSFTSGTENEGPSFNTQSLIGAWDQPPFVHVVGWQDGHTLGGVVRNAAYGEHGDTRELDSAQRYDLTAFLECNDGTMAFEGIEDLEDTTPPRILAVRPVSLDVVEVIFDESVDAESAGDPAHYVFTDGEREIEATDADHDGEAGHRVRVSVPLVYDGSEVTWTLLPGPVEDRAASYGMDANNILDTDDPANEASFTIDGTITVTFGNTGSETFPSAARSAAFTSGLSNVSFAHILLYPFTSIEIKGFVAFDFIDTLADECGVDDGDEIVAARFTAQPLMGHTNTIELRRCLLPWQEPPNDWCFGCSGAPTLNSASHPNIAWHTRGARALGSSGDDPDDYYPEGEYDLAETVDATVDVEFLNERVEFASDGITEAFAFWFDNPEINFGYGVEVVGDEGTGLEFVGASFDGGRQGIVLSITFEVEPNDRREDSVPFIRGDGIQDGVIALGDVLRVARFIFLEGPSGGCEEALDVDDDGRHSIVDIIYLASYLFLERSAPEAPFPGCGTVLEADSLGCDSHDACD